MRRSWSACLARLKRPLLWTLAAVLIACSMWALESSSKSFQRCLYYADRSYQQEEPEKKSPLALNFLEVRLGCGIDFANDNTGALTFAVGLFVLGVYVLQARIMSEQHDTSRATQRAFLSVEALGVNETTGGRPIARVRITNAGALPATRIWWEMDAAIDAANRRIFTIDENGATKDSTNLLAPKVGMDRNFPCRPFANWNDFQSSDSSRVDRPVLYVWGAVHYRDGFGQDRWTKFCFRYEHDGIGVGAVDGRPGTGVSAKSARQHQWGNGTDDD